VADALLFAVVGSNWSECETLAVFVCALAETRVACRVRNAPVPAATVPMFQTPVPGVYEPLLSVGELSVSPAGSRSSTPAHG